jgi:hypothetical protein
MAPPIPLFLFALLFLFGMLVALELGHRYAVRQTAIEDRDKIPLATIETAVFALFGLLIAFTFSGAASRFQEKRMLIAEEANSIQTAYRSIDLVAPPARAKLRALFREYVDARLELYHRLPDVKAAAPTVAKLKQLQATIWATAVATDRLPSEDPSAARMMLPAIDQLLRIATNRTMQLQNHPPGVVYGMLFALGLLCSMLVGFRMPVRSWLHILSFTLVTASVVYISLDIEYPRVGLIRLDRADQVLSEVRASMDGGGAPEASIPSR